MANKDGNTRKIDLTEGPTRSISVGLHEGELKVIDEIAEDLNVTRNNLMRFFMRWSVKSYLSGEINLEGYLEEPPPTKKILRIPD
jgi:hypothetical protein